MSPASSAWLLFWGVRKSLVGINENNGGDLIPKSPVLLRTAILIQQCEVSRCHTGGTGFLGILYEFFEPIETIISHDIPFSQSDLVEQILYD
jgi:hypothetical protein